MIADSAPGTVDVEQRLRVELSPFHSGGSLDTNEEDEVGVAVATETGRVHYARLVFVRQTPCLSPSCLVPSSRLPPHPMAEPPPPRTSHVEWDWRGAGVHVGDPPHTPPLLLLSEGESPFGEGQGAWPRSLPEVERENDDAPEKRTAV
jgi:hypothetical protein